MRQRLLISALAASVSGLWAQDPAAGFVLPQIPAIQVSAVEEGTEEPIPFVSISVEYADTIITQSTDEKGKLDFTPLEFPLTLTANCDGMEETTFGLFEHPEEPLTIIMVREPADNRKNLSAISSPLSTFCHISFF